MRVSISEWMKDPAKWMKRACEYHRNMSATSMWIHEWSQTPEGQERLKRYLQKRGYILDDNGKWVKKSDNTEKTD